MILLFFFSESFLLVIWAMGYKIVEKLLMR